MVEKVSNTFFKKCNKNNDLHAKKREVYGKIFIPVIYLK